MQVSRQSRPAALCLLCMTASLAAVLPASGWAQQTQPTGGVLINFGIEEGIYWKDNPSLNIPSKGSEASSRTKLNFGLVSETRIQKLAFTAQGTLVAGNGREKGMTSPSVNLSYSRTSAATTLDFSAFLRSSDVSTLDLLNGIDGTGAPIVVAVSGTGTQRQTGANTTLTFGQNSRFGGSFSLGLTDTKYLDTTDPTLIDNRRNTAKLSLRFDLNETTTANLGLSGSQLKDQGAPTDTNSSVAHGLVHVVPDGTYTADLGTANSKDGARQSLRFGRSLDLPAAKISGNLGVVRLSSGSTQVIGALDWQQQFASGGALTLGLSRNVTNNSNNNETRVSQLTMSYNQPLTPTLDLGLSAGLQQSSASLTGLKSTGTDFSASLSKQLTPDWAMNFGASHQIRDRNSSGRAASSTVFLTIGRNFAFRP